MFNCQPIIGQNRVENEHPDQIDKVPIQAGFFTSRKGKYEIVEITGLYWHFVDLVWVFIFALFYLW